jgi:hypothetical protein
VIGRDESMNLLNPISPNIKSVLSFSTDNNEDIRNNSAIGERFSKALNGTERAVGGLMAFGSTVDKGVRVRKNIDGRLCADQQMSRVGMDSGWKNGSKSKLSLNSSQNELQRNVGLLRNEKSSDWTRQKKQLFGNALSGNDERMTISGTVKKGRLYSKFEESRIIE